MGLFVFKLSVIQLNLMFRCIKSVFVSYHKEKVLEVQSWKQLENFWDRRVRQVDNESAAAL